MYTASKYDSSVIRIHIGFTKSGCRGIRRLFARHGQSNISVAKLERDLAEYIERHLDAGVDMISEFDVRYDDGIMLTVYLSDGVYYIKEATSIGEVIAFKAILVWQRIKHGCDYLIRQVVSGWYFITAPQPAVSC